MPRLCPPSTIHRPRSIIHREQLWTMDDGRWTMSLWCCSLIALLTVPVDGAVAEVKAGVAQETFKLPRGVPLAGYSRRKGAPSRGVHDPVGARALVLEEGPTTAILVSCDLLIVDEVLFNIVRRRLIEAGVPKDVTIILAATHTHSGPGAYGNRFAEKISMGHYDPHVVASLVDTITRVILRAREQLTPVRVASQTITTSGLVTNRMVSEGLTDPELGVSAVYAHDAATPLAVAVNFAAHPTTLGAWNRLLSADYPGVTVREIEAQLPGAQAMFFAGAVGDQAPVKTGTAYEPANRMGRALGHETLALLRQAQPAVPTHLGSAQESMRLPPAQVRLSPRLTFPGWVSRRLVDDDATLSVILLGDTVFFGVPCDLDAELGLALKDAARSRGLHPMVIGFASDYIGYCVSEPRYASGAYEALMAFNGPTTGRLVVDHLTKMLDQLVKRKP